MGIGSCRIPASHETARTGEQEEEEDEETIDRRDGGSMYIYAQQEALLVDLAELAESVAVGAHDLRLVLPRRVRPQRRAGLAHRRGEERSTGEPGSSLARSLGPGGRRNPTPPQQLAGRRRTFLRFPPVIRARLDPARGLSRAHASVDSPPLPRDEFRFYSLLRSISPQVRSNSRALAAARAGGEGGGSGRSVGVFAWLAPSVRSEAAGFASLARVARGSSPPSANPNTRLFLSGIAPIRPAARGFGNPAVVLE